MKDFLMYAEYSDGHEEFVHGRDEEDCMYTITKLCDKHGDCTYYTSVNDEYHVDGEYVDPDDLVYD